MLCNFHLNWINDLLKTTAQFRCQLSRKTKCLRRYVLRTNVTVTRHVTLSFFLFRLFVYLSAVTSTSIQQLPARHASTTIDTAELGRSAASARPMPIT